MSIRPRAGLSEDERLRRSRSLVLYFRRRGIVAEDFLAHSRYAVNDDAVALLRLFERWRTIRSVLGELRNYEPRSVVDSIQLVQRKGLLIAEGTEEARHQEALGSWAQWDPVATYFHFATRSSRFARTRQERRRILARVIRSPMPLIYKSYPHGPRLVLPKPTPRMAPATVGRTLLVRRTCREFLRGRRVPRQRFEALISLGFGRLGLIDGGPLGTLLHRSAPSAGARHPIECYALVFEVTGVDRGLYHYSVEDNALVRLRSDVSRRLVTDFTWGQRWFAEAAVVFLFTAIFARTQWKYRVPRAYRVVLLDAAHLCQNLLLIATALGLGASCTAALDEEAIDRYIGLDGITEGSLYLAAVGMPDRARIRRAIRPGGLLPGEPA